MLEGDLLPSSSPLTSSSSSSNSLQDTQQEEKPDEVPASLSSSSTWLSSLTSWVLSRPVSNQQVTEKNIQVIHRKPESKIYVAGNPVIHEDYQPNQ